MIDTPAITKSAVQLAAVIRLTIPRDQIQSVMGPGIDEVMAAVAAQGIGPSGPVFSHHFQMDPKIFDFEIGVPVTPAPDLWECYVSGPESGPDPATWRT